MSLYYPSSLDARVPLGLTERLNVSQSGLRPPEILTPRPGSCELAESQVVVVVVVVVVVRGGLALKVGSGVQGVDEDHR